MPYICEKCGKSFTSQSNYKIHINRVKPCIIDIDIVDNDGIKCDFCNNSFTRKSGLDVHLSRCVVRKNPELLLKHIEKQKDIIIKQKDIIIKQKDDIIIELRNYIKQKDYDVYKKLILKLDKNDVNDD